MSIAIVAKPDEAAGFAPGMWIAAYPGAHRAGEFIAEHSLEFMNRTVLDAGTGCGYAAIAAGLAGARRVVAADQDRNALRATALNAAANGIAHKIETRVGDITTAPLFAEVGADIIIAADTFYDPIITRGLTGQLLQEAGRGKGILAASSDNTLPRLKTIGQDISCNMTGPNGRTVFVHAVWVPPKRAL